jgi:hypothetical protein
MPRMIPLLSEEQIRSFPSRAEARFYQACQVQLPDDYVVIYSAEWLYRDTNGRLIEGEADFTIISPSLGLLVVEVKGGGINFDHTTGGWTSIDRSGVSHSIKDPFKQASRERHALIDQIRGHVNWKQSIGTKFTVGHAVFLPDISDPNPFVAMNRPLEIIGVNGDLANIVHWTKRASNFSTHSDDVPLGPKLVRVIENILCSSINVGPVMRAAMDDIEGQRVKLTANQSKIFRIIGGRRRVIISGGAGTGKTVLAAERAKSLTDDGLDVLLLCYNRPLADALANSLRTYQRIKVRSFHQLCDERVRQSASAGTDIWADAVEAYPGENEFDVQMPYALALSGDILEEKFDAILVDEAQDFSDEYWFGIESLLRKQEEGHLYIFLDENQTLYSRKGELPIQDEPFYLTNNCRNTSQIHKVGYRFYKGATIDLPELSGTDVIWHSKEKAETQADAISERVNHLIHVEHLKPEDLVVLVAKKPKEHLYILLEQRRENAGVDWSFEVHGKKNCVLVDTVARFKGLEAQAVILWVGDELANENRWETAYVGATRAKSALSIVGSQKALADLKRELQ